MAFHTNILCCRDEKYYVGHTDDLERRIAQHQSGALPGYTARRLPVVFLWVQDFQTRDDAFAVERKLKGWSRAKKEAMMAGDWALVSQLARSATQQGASTCSA
jgi:predicted GIY-YIG superfamily endonuclease